MGVWFMLWKYGIIVFFYVYFGGDYYVKRLDMVVGLFLDVNYGFLFYLWC